MLCNRGGDQATDQAPVTCWPNAAQSVVPGGLRAHTRETASPSLRGVADRAGSGAGALPRPPNPCPWGVLAACKAAMRAHCAGQGTSKGQGEETKRRAAAMMLSRTGRDRDPLLGRGQTGEGRSAPWGCKATGGLHLLLLLLLLKL